MTKAPSAIIFLCLINTASVFSNTYADGSSALPQSVSEAWEIFEKNKSFESFSDIHYLCTGKIIYWGNFVVKEKRFSKYEQVMQDYDYKDIDQHVLKRDKRAKLSSLGFEKAQEYISERTSAAIEAEMDYLFSLAPPSDRDRDWCAQSVSCMRNVDKLLKFSSYLEPQVEQCIEIANWYRE